MQNSPTTGRPLPSIADLHKDVQEAFKNDQLNLLLNQPPSDGWLKAYPPEMKIKGNGKYLPIDKVDFLLKYIFGRTKIEVAEAKQIGDSMHIVVRIHYKDPITGEWDFQDGVGAHPIYPNAGGVKTSTAIAKQAAKKDAADELGAVFGRDLGRKDVIMFTGSIQDPGTNGHEQPKSVKGDVPKMENPPPPTINGFAERYKQAHETPGQLTPKPEPLPFTFNPTEL